MELKALALEYRKLERTSNILFTGKKHANIRNARNIYQKYQLNDIKIKHMMEDINICNSVDFSKEKEQQDVSIDKDVACKIIGDV